MDSISYIFGWLVEMNGSIRPTQLGCVRGFVLILGNRLEFPAASFTKNLFKKIGAEAGQAIMQLPRRFRPSDRCFHHAQYVPGIDAVSEGDDTQARRHFTIDDGPVDRGCAAVAWKK